jgi:hypothetical protein
MKKARAVAISLVIFLFLPLITFSQVLNEIYSEPLAGFNYEVPKGWTLAEIPGMKYKIALGTRLEGFSPNINVIDEAFNGSVEDYANASLKQIEALFENFKKLDKSIFITNSGLKGIKLVTEATQQKKYLRQTFYFFKGKAGKMFVITCSVLAKQGGLFSGIFDKSIKTFEVK